MTPLTFFAFAIPPVVAIVFGILLLLRRDPVSQPSIVAAVPLGLSSIAILLGQSAVILLATFQEIATHRTAGMKAVVSGLLSSQQPLAWGFVDFGVCLIAIILFTVFLRYSRDEETPLMRAYIPLPALIVTAVFAVSLFLMVYLQYSTVDLVMMIVDTRRNQELASQYGTVSPAYFASGISSRLVAIALLSVLQALALIVAGTLDLFWRQKEHHHQRFAMVLTLGALVVCAASVLSEFGFVEYLQHVR